MKTLGKLALAGLVAGGLAFAAAAPAEAQHVSVGVGVPYPGYGPGYYANNPCYSPYADPYYCGGYPAYYDDYDYGYPGFIGFGFGHGFHGHGFHGGGHGFHGGGSHSGGGHGGHR